MGKVLRTDLYEATMAASFLRRGMTDTATFSLYVRRLPPSRGFLVAAGLEDCLSYLEAVRFEDEDLVYLSQLGFDEESVEALSSLRFTGDVDAVPEGRVVFADEPLLEVTAPLPEAQFVETVLVNYITYETTLATKAARCVLAAGDIALYDFALRRTHGLESGMALARACAIAGFRGTSNVEAARVFGLQAAGTMAHSYVEAFADEQTAFSAFAEDFPDRSVFLVDTYDTIAGVEAAIEVIAAGSAGGRPGIRIDSGDLHRQSRAARILLDKAGLGDVRIFVSGGLDEFALETLAAADAPIDAAGVGSALGVSADAPSLDTAYKLVEVGGRPVMKLSPGKTSLPGSKQTWRGSPIDGDVLALRDEAGPDSAEGLLVPVMRNGARSGAEGSIEDSRRRLRSDLAELSPGALDLLQPEPPPVAVSPALARLAREVENALRASGGA